MFTKAQLIAAGVVPNKNAWIGDGWFYCKGHEAYAFHSAWSKPGDAVVFEICLVCDEYHGNARLPLKGSAVPVASDILENAKELTRRYARVIASDLTPESIAEAQRVQREERERVFQRTGVRITDEGTVTP